MKIFKNKILIFSIILASVLRFYQLNTLPALNADEAAIGYNAYSLIKTGLDEHGNSWPIHFESFADYKPGLYFYLVLPFVYIFDLSIFAVRFPGALIGVLNIIAVWFLCRELWPDKKRVSDYSALLLAVSPWHIHFSRGGWEVNIATFFITLGVLYLVKSFKNSKWFALSSLSFVASLYTYHSARLIVPLLGLSVFIFNYKKILSMRDKRMLFGSLLLGAVLLLPLAMDFLGPAGAARAGGVSIFADRGPIDRINEKRGQHESANSLFTKIVHNKFVEYTFSFSENYIEHFNGDFLFLSGDVIQRNKVPETGLLYLFQVAIILIALVSLSRDSKNANFVFLWLIVSPIAASLTFQSPHALRAQNMVIPLTILSGYGLYVLEDNISKYKKKYLFVLFHILAGILLVWNLSGYIYQYYFHMAKSYPYSSQYGVSELVDYIKENQHKYQKIYVTDSYDQPYVLFLFYLKYPPQDFQYNHSLTERDNFGFSTVRNFDKFEFTAINEDNLSDERDILIVGTDREILKNQSNVIKTIYFPNGEIAFEIVEQ